MSRIQSVSLLAALLSASQVAAHGHALALIANGVSYQGWDTDSFPYMSDPPKVAAWSTPNLGNGFVSPSKYGTEDIICHQDAKNAEGYVEVAAGDRVQVQWTDWPESHHGPVIDYLANCGESCTTVDKTTLEFFKIDGVGYEDGTWGDDQLIANDNSWMVEIPKSITPGNYVLRHELIALHSAGDADGAQSYPQCFNLKVTGSGTDKPAGVVGTKLYTASDPGILFNIYGDASSYEVPGPALYSGAVSIKQTTSAVTATGTATTGSAAVSTAISISTTISVSTAIAVPSTTFATIPVRVPSSTPSSSSAPFPSSSTSYPSSTPTSSSAPTAAPGDTQQVYSQCGGKNWTGGSVCAAGSTCKDWNPYYSQCVPVEFQ